MARTNTTRKKPHPKLPQEAIAKLARNILMFGTVEDRPTFCDLLFEALLIKVLPAGPEAALSKIRGMRLAPQEHAEGVAWLPSEPNILNSVLAQAESDLAVHITRIKTWNPKTRSGGAISRKARALAEFL